MKKEKNLDSKHMSYNKIGKQTRIVDNNKTILEE